MNNQCVQTDTIICNVNPLDINKSLTTANNPNILNSVFVFAAAAVLSVFVFKLIAVGLAALSNTFNSQPETWGTLIRKLNGPIIGLLIVILTLPLLRVLNVGSLNAALDVPDLALIENINRVDSGAAPASQGTYNVPASAVGLDQITQAGGIYVNKNIASNIQALMAAAKNDSISLGGSGYRDPGQQISLRRQNCGPSEYDIYNKSPRECRPPTAIPGSSNHEKGLAIDFNCAGVGGASFAKTACFTWLSKNASKYGLYNYKIEPWHWSVDGR